MSQSLLATDKDKKIEANNDSYIFDFNDKILITENGRIYFNDTFENLKKVMGNPDFIVTPPSHDVEYKYLYFWVGYNYNGRNEIEDDYDYEIYFLISLPLATLKESDCLIEAIVCLDSFSANRNHRGEDNEYIRKGDSYLVVIESLYGFPEFLTLFGDNSIKTMVYYFYFYDDIRTEFSFSNNNLNSIRIGSFFKEDFER